jgi:hypothetical protein
MTQSRKVFSLHPVMLHTRHPLACISSVFVSQKGKCVMTFSNGQPISHTAEVLGHIFCSLPLLVVNIFTKGLHTTQLT